MDEPRNAVEAVTHLDPYGWYRRQREAQPIGFDESLDFWVASGAEAVVEAFNHAGLRVRPPAEPVPRPLQGTTAGDVFALLVRMTDGEFQARHKPHVVQAATRWSLEEVARTAIAASRDVGPRADPNALLTAIPVRAMARLLGVPPADLDVTATRVERFAQGIAPGASADAVSAASEAARALMAQGEAEGLAPVAAANRIALMQQALDATAGLLGNTVLRLMTHAEEAKDAHRSPETMRLVVAEVARWDAPVQNTRRFAAGDLTLAGRVIKEGQGVLLVLASANRDPALNPEPDRFWPGRPDPRALGFGAGAHACPGERIAVEIVAAAIETLLASGSLASRFGRHEGYRPLPNARIPVFTDA